MVLKTANGRLVHFIFTILCIFVLWVTPFVAMSTETITNAQSCSIDLHNQSQVIERLAELKSRILKSSQSKTDLAILNLFLIPQIKQFAEKFGVDEKEFAQLVENKAGQTHATSYN